MSDNFTELIEGPKQFAKDSIKLINRCTKPDKRGTVQCRLNQQPTRRKTGKQVFGGPEERHKDAEKKKKGDRLPAQHLSSTKFFQISRAVGIGFLLMGFIGFIVKLIHIPINNIIV
ncbi:Sec61p translocation complex subunit [Phlyctochytrium planicorne]|nr:Sec61p translocation complex subunit [Phlyctochytrium planicorne]